MASLQAHLAVWFTKWRVKRRLKGCRDYRSARAILRPLPYKIPASVRITPANVNGIPGEWVESPNSTDAVLFYLHGGGYAICSIDTHRRLAYDISAVSGARILVIDYRLAPEHPFPAAIEDATKAVHPIQSRRSPAKIAAAAASSTGMEPTISEAWLTVVRSRPWNCMRNCTGTPKR